MVWSQLKKQVRALLCDELRDRVDFHRAVYRQNSDSLPDRVWITIDGEQVFQLSSGERARVEREALCQVEHEHRLTAPDPQPELDGTIVAETDMPSTDALGNALHRYLELSIAEALQSPDPIIRAIALLDRRTGRRPLARLSLPPDEHPLVRAFYELRMAQA